MQVSETVNRGLLGAIAAALIAVAAAGCSMAIGHVGKVGGATLQVKPAIAQGAYRVQSDIPPGWVAADVNHVVVKLFKLDGTNEVAVTDTESNALVQDIAAEHLVGTLEFTNLNADTKYRVRGYAYKAAGTAAADLISKDDASYVDVTVERSETISVAKLDIQLADKVFESQATTSIELTDGAFRDATTSMKLKPWMVSTLAGGAAGSGSADGTGTDARFKDFFFSMPVDAQYNLYLSEDNSKILRKITRDGVVTTVATASGNASGCSDEVVGGYGAMAVDPDGNLYFVDTFCNVIRKRSVSGDLSTLAGVMATSGTDDGATSSAKFKSPDAIARASDGTLYVADLAGTISETNGTVIRKISPDGQVTTLAGDYAHGDNVDGTGSSAHFSGIYNLAAHPSGDLYATVYKFENFSSLGTYVKKITPDGVVTTLAGGGSNFESDGVGTEVGFADLYSIAVLPSEDLVVGEWGAVRRVTLKGRVTLLAGTHGGKQGYVDGEGPVARFRRLTMVAPGPDGSIFLGDPYNLRIRKLTPPGK